MMNLSEKISLGAIQNYIDDKTRAHNSLVFAKGSEINSSIAAMTKLAKKLCAIANSGGGKVIYGISSKRSRAEKLDPVINFTKSTDWLYNEIQSQIDMPLKDFELSVAQVNDKQSIFQFIIPANNDQPHMFSDSRYYKWQKSRAVILDEAEVRMLYGKLSSCELEFLGIYNTNGLPVLSAGKYTAMSFYPKILIRNAGNMVEKDYKIEISFPAKLYEETFQPLQALFIRHEGSHVVFGQKGNSPIFQQEISTIIEGKIAITKDNVDVFLNENLNITLYFSNGIKKHSLKLSDTLTYNGKPLQTDDFVDSRVLKMEI